MAEPKATPKNSPYNKKDHVPNGSGKRGQETARKDAKFADYPTTAAADPTLRLPESLQSVDPNMISQVLPNMYKQLMQVRDFMNIFNSTNKGGSENSTPAGSLRVSIVDVFKGALAISTKNFGYTKVLLVLFNALGHERYKGLLPEYHDIVFEAIINLIKDAATYGEADIPISDIPEINYSTKIPTPLYSSLEEIGDGYVQQYYTATRDPYPGYLTFYNSITGIYRYMRRSSTQYPYESLDQEVHTQAEYNFAAELYQYFQNNNLTVSILNSFLVKYCLFIEETKQNKAAGNNSNNQDILSMLAQFAGVAGTIASLVKDNHLPTSVLNVESVTKSIEEHRYNIGKAKKLASLSQTAFTPSTLLNTTNILPQVSSLFDSPVQSKSQVNEVANTIQTVVS